MKIPIIAKYDGKWWKIDRGLYIAMEKQNKVPLIDLKDSSMGINAPVDKVRFPDFKEELCQMEAINYFASIGVCEPV